MSEMITAFVLDAITDIEATLGEKWALLTLEQRTAAHRAVKRVLELEIRLKQLQASGADVTEVNDDLDFVKVTVSEFTVAGQIGFADAFEKAFWKGVDKALAALGSFLVGAGKGLIPGL
jgi:hypothetical protein